MSEPTIWGVLGLDGPTDDEIVIKAAYAKQLRVVRPDEDQSGFMALRNAFDAARNYAQGFESDDVILNAGDTIEKIERDQQMPVTAEPGFKDLVLPKIQDLLWDAERRNIPKEWQNLFNQPELQSLDTELDFKILLKEQLLSFLGYYSSDVQSHDNDQPPLTPETSDFIFQMMEWKDIYAYNTEAQHQLRFISERLKVAVIDPENLDAFEDGTGTFASAVAVIVSTVFFVGGIYGFTRLFDTINASFVVFGLVFGIFLVVPLHIVYRAVALVIDAKVNRKSQKEIEIARLLQKNLMWLLFFSTGAVASPL